MKKSLPSVRVNEKTIENMNSAIKKYNDGHAFQISLGEFRRLSYELLSRLILEGKEIPIKVSPDS